MPTRRVIEVTKMKLILILLLSSLASQVFAFDASRWRTYDDVVEHAKWKIELTTFVPAQVYYAFSNDEKDAIEATLTGKHTFTTANISKQDAEEVAFSTSSKFASFEDFSKPISDQSSKAERIYKVSSEIDAIEAAETKHGIDLTKIKKGKKEELKNIKRLP